MLFAGDFPEIKVIAATDNDPTPRVRVTQDRDGSPNDDIMALKLDGAVSMPFSVSSLDADKVSALRKHVCEIFKFRGEKQEITANSSEDNLNCILSKCFGQLRLSSGQIKH